MLRPKKETHGRQKASFRERVFAVVRKIQKGDTLTYGQVAKQAGNCRAARAVGAILNTNYDPGVPCHRVVRSDGNYGGYNRGAAFKKELLIKEKLFN